MYYPVLTLLCISLEAMSTALSNVHFEPTGNTEPAPETMLECRAQACPKLLYKGNLLSPPSLRL